MNEIITKLLISTTYIYFILGLFLIPIFSISSFRQEVLIVGAR